MATKALDANWEDYYSECEEEHEKWLERQPICECCGERIEEDTAVYFEEIDAWYCDDCIDKNRRDTQ